VRVLAIRPRALGDVVMVTPALRALKLGYPDASLEVLTEERYRSLLEGQGGVDRLWTMERSWVAGAELIVNLRARRFDLVVDFFGNPRTALITRLLGARRTAGYRLRGRSSAYRILEPRTQSWPGGRDRRPRREYAAATHLRLALAAGGRDDGTDTRLAVPPGSGAAAARLLEAAGLEAPERAIGLIAAATWPSKAWPAFNAGQLARKLAEAGREVLLIAGPGEDTASSVVRRHAPAIHELPPCGVGELMSVIARLSAVVGTDSGPKHLAASLGVPTFTWYGPTHPDTWSPPGAMHGAWWTPLPCRGCDRTRCPHWNCMPGLSSDRAAALVLEHLERHDRAAADLRAAAGA
jgi:ADP-heptose:LPS heptosyltransferase